MAISTSQALAVGSTATALTAADTGVSGTSVAVRNTHATVAVAIGTSGVTDVTGFRLPAGSTVTVDLASDEQLFGVRIGGTNGEVDVLRLGT